MGVRGFLQLVVTQATMLRRNTGWWISSIMMAVLSMAVSFFAFMALVQIADLSFAVPASAASVVLDTLLARLLLKEQVDVRRWAGAACVACGVYLLAL